MEDKIKIVVYGAKLDDDKKTVKDVELFIDKSTFTDFEDEVDLEDFIENEISNVTGYCHFGWRDYKVLNKNGN